jgi:hypothetical protein
MLSFVDPSSASCEVVRGCDGVVAEVVLEAVMMVLWRRWWQRGGP